MAKLRQRGQPITLFGEDDTQRAARLHKLEEVIVFLIKVELIL